MNQEPIQPDYNYILQQEAPEPKKSNKPKVVYALIGFLLLSLLSVAVVSLTLKPATKLATNFSDPEFILDIKNGRSQQAYDQLSPSVKTSYPENNSLIAQLLRR